MDDGDDSALRLRGHMPTYIAIYTDIQCFFASCLTSRAKYLWECMWVKCLPCGVAAMGSDPLCGGGVKGG